MSAGSCPAAFRLPRRPSHHPIHRPDATNLEHASTKSAGAVNPKVKITAELVCFARAAGALEPDPAIRNPDYLAREFIRRRFRLALLPGIRPLMEKVYDRRVPGMYLYHQARTRHIDALVTSEIAQAPPQLVILGAGLDSRAYRMRDLLRSTRVFEVDEPATGAWKQQCLQRWGGDFRHVTFVPVDFNADPLATRLVEAGVDPGLRTLFLMEGVSYYLAESALRQTMSVLAGAAAGSGLIFDFIDRDALNHPGRFLGAREFFPYAARRGEPILFGMAPAQVDAFVGQYGFSVVSTALADELQQRHLRLSDGTPRGRACDFFGIVLARRRAA